MESDRLALGLEAGSTRIKAILIDSHANVVAEGSYNWENRLIDGVWTYTKEDILNGLKGAYKSLKRDFKDKTGETIKHLYAIGISAMMHGYIPTNGSGELLSPFRTWRNTITHDESRELTELFDYPIPERWTISHLLKDIKEGREYIKDIKHIFTLASYISFLLTGKDSIGIGDASGMFPIDQETGDFDERCIGLFEEKYLSGTKIKLREIFPKIVKPNRKIGCLSDESRLLLDEEGDLDSGIPLSPPEGDAETGMVATNSIKSKTGNISAGTSAFAMIVLDSLPKRVSSTIDIVFTPDGKPVAMSHSNNCTTDYDAWISLFKEAINECGIDIPKERLYDILLDKALEKEGAPKGIVVYPFYSGEPILGLEDGRPIVVRDPDNKLTLSSFMKASLYSSIMAMKIGLDDIYKSENIKPSLLSGHGGFFKNEIGLKIMSSAAKTKIRTLDTAGEGGAWGMAILALYLDSDEPLEEFLDSRIFKEIKSREYLASEKEMEDFDEYLESFISKLSVEKQIDGENHV